MALKQGHLKLLIIISVNKHKKKYFHKSEGKASVVLFWGELFGWLGGWLGV